MHYHFHVNLFAMPPHAVVGPPVVLRGAATPTLRGVDGRPLVFEAFFPRRFEEAIDALRSLPRLDAEPDGFFVLAEGAGPTHWSVSGHLFDFGDRLHRVELHGGCPAPSFDLLLACLGWPATELAFELVAEGVALDESAFRSWASRGGSHASRA